MFMYTIVIGIDRRLVYSIVRCSNYTLYSVANQRESRAEFVKSNCTPTFKRESRWRIIIKKKLTRKTCDYFPTCSRKEDLPYKNPVSVFPVTEDAIVQIIWNPGIVLMKRHSYRNQMLVWNFLKILTIIVNSTSWNTNRLQPSACTYL